VVEAEEVHDGGLEVVDVDFVLGDAEAKLVGLARDCSRRGSRRRRATMVKQSG